ncbi:hypothetical protein HDG70_002089 [Carboxydothermus ferrireducens DSM 11255]|nr:hypothetical protein [Carboxydothermus ferrireducens DSM 11255]
MGEYLAKFWWSVFEATGSLTAYLIYKKLISYKRQ